MFKNRCYEIDTVGEARHCTTFTRGMLKKPDDHVSEMALTDKQFY